MRIISETEWLKRRVMGAALIINGQTLITVINNGRLETEPVEVRKVEPAFDGG